MSLLWEADFTISLQCYFLRNVSVPSRLTFITHPSFRLCPGVKCSSASRMTELADQLVESLDQMHSGEPDNLVQAGTIVAEQVSAVCKACNCRDMHSAPVPSLSQEKKALVSSIVSTVHDSLTTKWGKVRSQVFSGPFKSVSMGPDAVFRAIAALAPAVQAQKRCVRARNMSWRAPPCPSLHQLPAGRGTADAVAEAKGSDG